jgi:hypothetical protein
LIGATATLVSLSACGVAFASDHVVMVRAYNSYGLSQPAVRDASRTVCRLLSTAGLGIRWRDCRIAGRGNNRGADSCSDPLGPNEVIVRLVSGRAVVNASGTIALGDAFIDPVSRTGALATVYPDRVVVVSRALRSDLGTMVGRAITHEIAHLLLGTSQHTAFGLMRATWGVTAATKSETDWLFTEEQREQMRAAVGSRLANRTSRTASLAPCE